MSDVKPYARIAITLPPETLRVADELAALSDRSRSWVIAEAIRQYAARQGSTAAREDPASVIGASRLEQLRRDAMLSPEARVRASEEISAIGGTQGASITPLTFSSYNAFHAWLDQREQR